MCHPDETKKMVTQPSNAQGVKFNIQPLICILSLVNNQASRYSTCWIYQSNKAMRQRF